MLTRLVSVPNPLPSSVTSLAQIRCSPLATSLRPASASTSRDSATKPTLTEVAVGAVHRLQHVRVLHQVQVERRVRGGLLDLLRATVSGRKSATAAP